MNAEQKDCVTKEYEVNVTANFPWIHKRKLQIFHFTIVIYSPLFHTLSNFEVICDL